MKFLPRTANIALALAGLAVSSGALAELPDATEWTIGPTINGRNYSRGMPLHPSPGLGGWYIDLPQAPGSLHYVTFRHG